MKCQKTVEQTVYPVFYDVEPTEVRKQSGEINHALAKHEKKAAAGKWIEALKQALKLAGWDLKATANRNIRKSKGLVSKIKQLKQNFRKHVGVLDLAQSVIDILYHYFAHSIDNLEPETSLVLGEAPVLCKNSGILGFGAEQVILVCNEHTKAEIL